MTQDRDFERLLEIWLSDGPLVVADRVIDDVAGRIVRQPQRPAWRLRPWRFPTMSTQLRIALVGGALIAAVVGGALLVGGGASPRTPAPSAAPTSTPAPSAIAFRTESRLAAGTYAAQLEAGRLTFTLPTGWSSSDVSGLDFTLHLDAGPKDDAVKVFTDMRRASKGPGCAEAPENGVGPTAAELVQDLAGDAQLAVQRGGSIDIGVGIAGQIVDVSLAPSATRTCPFSNGVLAVPLVVDRIPGAGAFWGVGPKERIRLVILDAPRGRNLVVAIDSADGSAFQALVDATMPIVRSFSFDVGDPLPTLPPCEDDLFGCAGPMAAGAHQSVAFQPSLTFTTPDGWKNVVDTPTIFKLDRTSSPPSVILWSNPAIPDGCGPAIKPGSGHKVADFVAFVTSHPGIEVLSDTPGLVGRWPARTLDLGVKDGYTDGCPNVPGNSVQFIVDTDPIAGTPVYGVSSSAPTHVVFVDVNGATVIIQAYAAEAGGLEAVKAIVQPLIDSFQFEPAT